MSGGSVDALRIVVDARLVSGESGGVEAVVIGLASGLSRLVDGPERYDFVAWEGHEDWLSPYVGGPSRLVTVPRPMPPEEPPTTRLRRRIGKAVPGLRALWGRRPGASTVRGPPRSDPEVEGLRPDVIHFPFQRGFLTDIPSIFHPHDLQHVHLPDFFSAEERLQRESWYRALSRQAAMVAVATRWTKEDVERHFRLPQGKVRVVPLAPPIDAYPRPTERQADDALRRLPVPERFLLYPAQTWPHKNHIGLLGALSRLREASGLVVPLVLTGQRNAFAAEIERRAAELRVGAQVHWLGFVEPVLLATLYRRAHAVVIPSLFESASAPLWEAFRVGVPAACSDVTSLPDQAGEAALLFDPRDTDAVARAIAALWTDEDLRARLVAAGRERVAGLSWERTARIFRAHYRRVAGAVPGDEDEDLLGAPSPR